MSSVEAERLRAVKTFPSLVKYLRDELDWPIESDNFDELTFDYQPEELGLDTATAVKIKEIKQLRPLSGNQPWGIFFINFEPKQLPIVVLRRILRALVIKKRQSASRSHQATWQLHDLLFISSYGESDHRDITFAHFSEDPHDGDLPSLRVLGWDDENTAAHLEHAHKTLKDRLRWPANTSDLEAWRSGWSQAFVLRTREVITTAKGLAVRMAQLATAIRKRVNRVLAIESDKGALRKLHAAFKEALIHDLEKDDFADMYAQTITYGLLSARVSRPAGLVAENVADMVPVTNPFLRDLLSTFLTVGGRKGKIDFDELGINEVVQALRDANMEAVLRDFGDKNPQEDPVIHFYELFLKEYDPKKRMKRGVFYTPRPVVSFIVRSVDEILRTEFGLADGLADITTWGEIAKRHAGLKIPKGTKADDPFVQILDPAVGTGTFLVEVIDVIRKTMLAKWQKQGHGGKTIESLWNKYASDHLLPRIYGFELMMAPYAIAHMKVGLKLHETGYDFSSHERARIYLTNSLEPAQDFSDRFEFDAPALAHEAHAVNAVKRQTRFTVLIGNPPYSKHSSNHGEWLNNLLRGKDTLSGEKTDNYFEVDGAPLGERNPKWLHDDYVKFIRFSQWRIEKTGQGVLVFITNHGYLDNPTFRGMRQGLMQTFDRICLLDLHGNIKKKEKAPDGSQDENVFDIQQGVSIGLLARLTALKHLKEKTSATVRYADIFGLRGVKYEWLRNNGALNTDWIFLNPRTPKYLFRPQNDDLAPEYEQGWLIQSIFPNNAVGFQTHRDYFVLDISREDLLKRMRDFADPSQSDDAMRKKYFSHMPPSKYPMGDTRDWSLTESRRVLRRISDLDRWITKCIRRPFDLQWYFYHPSAIDYGRPQVMENLINRENMALLWTRPMSPNYEFSVFTANVAVDQSVVGNKSVGAGGTYVAALYQYPKPGLFDDQERSVARGIGCSNLAPVFINAVAANLRLATIPSGCGDLKRTFGPEDILHYIYAVFYSPTYRSRYAQFLKRDFPRLPLTGEVELFRALVQLGSELVALHLMESPKLDKHLTKFIGSGRPEVEKVSYMKETVWIDKEQMQGFRGVPENVWNFYIGGYQVCEKWPKDRKGRTLSKEDIDHYHRIVVALHETIRLMAEIDKVIDAHGGWPGAFSASGAAQSSPTEDLPLAAESSPPYS